MLNMNLQFFAHKNQVSETAAAGCQLYGNSKLWIFPQGSAHTYEKIGGNPLRDAIPHRQKELRRAAPTPVNKLLITSFSEAGPSREIVLLLSQR